MARRKVAAWSIGVVLALLVIGYAFIEYTFSGWGQCANTIFETSSSPGGTHQVVVFQRDCGATTGFSTQVSILDAGISLPDGVGNVYIASGHPKDSQLEITWPTNSKLIIKNADPAASKTEAKIGSIEIAYE